MSVGQLSCFLSYATQYTKPFNEISGVTPSAEPLLAQRVFDLIEESTPDSWKKKMQLFFPMSKEM